MEEKRMEFVCVVNRLASTVMKGWNSLSTSLFCLVWFAMRGESEQQLRKI
jgi:hypothetical protein